MKNGIICKEDGDALLEIYRAINVWDGSLNRNLTMDEMVLIFALGRAIKEDFDGNDHQITSYNAKKVIEELENIKDNSNDKILSSDSPQYYDGFTDGIDKAIKIVKGE